MSVLISSVERQSYAKKYGICPGEFLVSINGHDIVDVLDYRFYQINIKIQLVIRNKKGELRNINIRKSEYDEIGLGFNSYLIDNQHCCKNKCIFCFIDQLPKGMRESLYFKDDDSRLSFLFGNYITLTNLSEHEIKRIIDMHISPINISVHTTNPDLRVKMMRNRFAGKSLEILRRFAQASIKINCQIVACPGINDGNELIKTLDDLERLGESLESVAIVPLGLTKYRDGLYPLKIYNKNTAIDVIKIVESFGERCINNYGRRIAFAADEFYIKAGIDLPCADFYESFSQLENGIGMIALLEDEFYYALDTTAFDNVKRNITIASGTAAAPFIMKLLNSAKNKYNGISGQVVAIRNMFFGENINVAGLVTGKDLINQLKGLDLGDELLIPRVMLRREGDMFLDNVAVEDVSGKLGIKVTPVNNNGQDLLNNILGCDR